MYNLFEPGDLLNSPYEAILFDTAKHSFPIRAHWHHYMEIILMEEGAAIVECDENKYCLRPGTWLPSRPRVFMPSIMSMAAKSACCTMSLNLT